MSRRVVVTGMGGITALGHDWPTVEANLRAGRNAIQRIPEWDMFENMNTRLGAPVTDFAVPAHWPRKNTRSMGRVAQLAVAATESALRDAGLTGDASIQDGRMGVAYGSSFGSMDPIRLCGNALSTGSTKGITSTSYLQAMSHTWDVQGPRTKSRASSPSSFRPPPPTSRAKSSASTEALYEPPRRSHRDGRHHRPWA